VIITPPFWRTWWFQLLAVSLVIFLLITWHRSRMHNLRLRYKTESEMVRIYEKYSISNREKEIIRLIIRGRSNKEIEDELFISIRTVKSHIYKIYQKFGVKSRLELINLIQKSMKE
jgi:DNA-binding CsgD family transcriptional regulator